MTPDDGRMTEAEVLESLPLMLDRAHQAVSDVLEGLQASRVALQDAQQSAVGRLHHTHAKLREVTSTTEGAASEILDALDRAQGLLDTLDAEAEAATPDAARASTARAALRDELFGMMNALQFQDITTQQLSYTSGVLTDLEGRLATIVSMFNGSQGRVIVPHDPRSAAAAKLYAPDATMEDAEARQQVADQIFVGTT